MQKLSIITINYNNDIGLEKTLKSIHSQSYSGFEHVLIDGGSTDDSVDIIKSYQDKITYWVSEKDKGIYDAMNKGVLKANNEYVLFLNSGDEFVSSEALSRAMPFVFEKDLISFKINYVGETSIKVVTPPKEMTFSYMYEKTLPNPSTFINKKMYNQVGFYDCSLKIASDWKFFVLALFKFNCSYKRGDVLLVNFYLDGISSNKVMPNEADKVLIENFPRYIKDYEKLIAFERQASTYAYKLFFKLQDYFFFKKLCSLVYKLFFKKL